MATAQVSISLLYVTSASQLQRDKGLSGSSSRSLENGLLFASVVFDIALDY